MPGASFTTNVSTAHTTSMAMAMMMPRSTVFIDCCMRAVLNYAKNRNDGSKSSVFQPISPIDGFDNYTDVMPPVRGKAEGMVRTSRFPLGLIKPSSFHFFEPRG